MDLVEINKISEKLVSINAEREALKKKKAQMQNRFEKRMAQNQADIDKLQTQSNEIENLRYFKRDEVMPVIAHLVSLIEGKKFYYNEIMLPISWDYEIVKGDYDRYGENQKLRLIYLSHNKKKTQEEIKIYINRLKNSSYSREYEVLKEFFLTPKDSYVQINIYSKYFGSSVMKFLNNLGINEVYYRDCHICYEDTTWEYKNYLQNHESHIRDERFIYIIDFMEYLVGKRYEKESHELTQEEMFRYATEFAEEYNKHDVMKRIREHKV